MDCFTIALGKKTGTTFPVTFDNKHNYNALYDTGTSASLINYSAYVSLGQDLDTGYQPFIKNASGEYMGALGQVTCTFTFTFTYLILAHSMDSVTAVSLLRELHTTACLRQLQVDLWDKSVKLSFFPFCAYAGGNDHSYLNHIIIMHYNVSYRCGQCLKQEFICSSVMHTHKKVCLGFTSAKAARAPGGKPSSGRGDSGHGDSSKATPKKDSKATAANSQGSSNPLASHP